MGQALMPEADLVMQSQIIQRPIGSTTELGHSTGGADNGTVTVARDNRTRRSR